MCFRHLFLPPSKKICPTQSVAIFDLIAGTSTGAIIALGLGFGLTPKQMVEFYVKHGPAIFPAARRRFWRRGREFFSSRYDSKALHTALTEVFGTTQLGELNARLLIPTFNAAAGRIYVYKTPYHPRLEMDYKAQVVDVAMATTAAPTYLPSHTSPERVVFIDGGIWANNPTGMAIVDAISMLNADRKNIEVLSLGCTHEPQDFANVGTGRLAWAAAAIEAAMCGQSFGSMGTAYQLIGHDHVLRVQPEVQPGRFALDKTEGIKELQGFGYCEARHAMPQLRLRFFDDVAEPYEPCHKLIALPDSRIARVL